MNYRWHYFEPFLTDDYILVSFNVVNMLPNIGNKLVLKSFEGSLFDNSFDLNLT